jgi:LuxR family maltose regulon positive regulatory protein
MARSSPTIWVTSWGGETQASVTIADEPVSTIRLDTEAWQAWLEAPGTVSFSYPIFDRQVGYIRGWMTVRKERRERGGHYWVAYRRTGSRVRKIYLGRTSNVTQQQLAASARRFLAMEGSAASEAVEQMEERR